MAESERVGGLCHCIFPSPTDVISNISQLTDKVEKICEENSLQNDSTVMQIMTSCPNGCAWPYIAGQSHLAFLGYLCSPTVQRLLLSGKCQEHI
jgi:sulfite reductase beta subunit-like hemoprotein